MILYYWGQRYNACRRIEDVPPGARATFVDYMTRRFYFGRTLCEDGTVTAWVRPVENTIEEQAPEWDEGIRRWVLPQAAKCDA